MTALKSFLLVLSFIAFHVPAFADENPATGVIWHILADIRPFTSIEEAAGSEQSINWTGPAIPAQTACTLGFAVSELQRFLARASGDAAVYESHLLGKSIPANAIVVATLEQARAHEELDRSIKAASLGQKLDSPGSFAIIPKGNRLFIIGGDRGGALHGAYAFLESLGIRWYGPEAHEIHVPELDPLALPATSRIESPDFQTRGFWVGQDRSNEAFFIWMARNRLNFWSIAEPNRALLHKLGIQLTYGGHHHFVRYMNTTDPYPYDHPLYKGDEDKPEDPYPANPGSFTGDADNDGILSFFEARPEWYGLIDGERTPFEGHLKQANICTSNAAAMDHIYSGIVRDLAEGEWQDVSSINLWPVDMGKWCECAECGPLGPPTDRTMLMIHGLDQAIKAAQRDGRLHRTVKVVFPIYLETLDAPSRPLPEDFDYETCIGTFFPIQRCYVHSIDDPSCTEYNSDHWETLLDWTQREPRHYRGEIIVGEYFNVSVNKSLPVVYSRIIATDIPKYHGAGARHMHYMHTDVRLLGVKRLNNYLYAKMLWDLEADVAVLKDEYMHNLYGPVAGDMARLYDRLEFGLSNIKQLRYWHHLPERLTEDLDPLFHTEHFQLEERHPPMNDGVDLAQSVAAMKECRGIMNTLLARDLPREIQSRLLIDDKTMSYGENTVYFYDAFARAELAERAGDLDRARLEFIRSIPFARALKAEEEVVKTAVNHHVHAEDGLDATRAETAYRELGEKLFPGFSL